MDQDIDLRGSAYFNNKTKYKFTAKEVLNIKKDILAGIPVEVLAKKYNLIKNEEIEIGEKAMDIIVEALKKLNNEKKLSEQFFDIYEKFVMQ